MSVWKVAAVELALRRVADAKSILYSCVMPTLSQEELLQLPPAERLDLISRLWDSLEDEHVPLTAEQAEELDRRLETLESDRSQGVTWEVVKAELERRCP